MFCKVCNHETDIHCYYCRNSFCRKHIIRFPGVDDFVSLQSFLEGFFVNGGEPYISSSVRDGIHTYRNFYEKVLPYVTSIYEEVLPLYDTKRDIELYVKAFFCKNCTQIPEYFNNLLLPVLNRAKLREDICSISTWCLLDTKIRCDCCGKYSCKRHVLRCRGCKKFYCADAYSHEETRENSNGDYDLFIVPTKHSCAGRHKHWLCKDIWQEDY
ncbi:MAG: hypothetical protein KGJ87_03120 [Planctomycetota bacterium]|nr:hypothetical protein [Planctomycetota bacterium]